MTLERIDRLRHLAALGPRFDDHNQASNKASVKRPSPSGEILVQHAASKDAVRELHRLLHDDGWILPDFDWSTWFHSPESRAFFVPDGAIESMGEDDLARILGALVGQERFSEGA